MGINHRLLYRVQAALTISKTFDCKQCLAINLAEKCDATVDRAIMHVAVDGLADRNCASTAIALPTTFLSATGMLESAEVFEQCQIGRKPGRPAFLTIEEKANFNAAVYECLLRSALLIPLPHHPGSDL